MKLDCKEYENKMKKSIAAYETALADIRAGRANPHVLDKLRVDYYGTPTPIQQVANVHVPEPRRIQIQPWMIWTRSQDLFILQLQILKTVRTQY